MTSNMKSTMFFLLTILCNGVAFSQARAVIDVHFHTDTGKFLPREFVGAGLGERFMFGSDPHPGAITLSIRTAYARIDAADFLSDVEKDNIFIENACRTFQFTTEE